MFTTVGKAGSLFQDNTFIEHLQRIQIPSKCFTEEFKMQLNGFYKIGELLEGSWGVWTEIYIRDVRCCPAL